MCGRCMWMLVLLAERGEGVSEDNGREAGRPRPRGLWGAPWGVSGVSAAARRRSEKPARFSPIRCVRGLEGCGGCGVVGGGR